MMRKKFVVGIITTIVFACVSLCSIIALGGWSEADCHEAFIQLWWHFAHEEGGENFFTVPFSYSGSHGLLSMGRHSKDYETMLENLDTMCSDLYDVTYTESAIVVRRLFDTQEMYAGVPVPVVYVIDKEAMKNSGLVYVNKPMLQIPEISPVALLIMFLVALLCFIVAKRRLGNAPCPT
jgi:hypothetical protein